MGIMGIYNIYIYMGLEVNVGKVTLNEHKLRFGRAKKDLKHMQIEAFFDIL